MNKNAPSSLSSSKLYLALSKLFLALVKVKNLYLCAFYRTDLRCVCVCVCVRERDRQTDRLCVCVTVTVCGWERESVCVCVRERERETVCVGERERVCVCVCVCVRERERESEWVCVCMCVWERESVCVCVGGWGSVSAQVVFVVFLVPWEEWISQEILCSFKGKCGCHSCKGYSWRVTHAKVRNMRVHWKPELACSKKLFTQSKLHGKAFDIP